MKHHYRTATLGQPKNPSRASEPIAIRDLRSGQRYELGLSRRQLTVGGASDCDIVISDRFASASHCSVQRVGERWILKDHNSKNGTRLNGTRIRLAELRPGNQIVVGDTRLEVLAQHALPSKHAVIGQHPHFRAAVDKAEKAARSQCSVLILGETGTGKEVIARAIHEASRRSEEPFVAVNCGAFPGDLIRSELFGHERGAFTGADSRHDGLFTQANGGTIFLDEIGELPLAQQPHLLRALESGLIRRVGGQHEELVNTRIIAATNRNCQSRTESPLRSDLYHRLSTVIIELPALRERSSDVPLLVKHFLALGEPEHGPHEVSEHVLQQLSRHAWHGNIRELRNSVARALALGPRVLSLADFLPGGIELPLDLVEAASSPQPVNTEGPPLSRYHQNQRAMLLAAYERNGTIRRAALELGMPKSTFADMCKRYNIDTRRRARIKL